MNEQTLRILLSSKSRNEAERIKNLFRNTGRATQAHRFSSLADLGECLNDQDWDVAICDSEDSELDPADIVEALKAAQSDTPVILLTGETNKDIINSGFQLGVQDVIEASNDEHLIFAAQREAKYVCLARKQMELEASLLEVSGRFNQLMSNADDAVAYVVDGFHINVNDAYASMFAFDDMEELLSMPLIDMVAAQDQDKFKVFLKHYNAEETQELSFNGVTEGGAEFEAQMRFAPATFDGEECTQIILRKCDTGSNEALTMVASNIDPVTQLYNRYHFVDTLEAHLSSGTDGASLLYIGLNDFAGLKSRLGLSGSHGILHRFADMLKERFTGNEDACLAHYGEDSYSILLKDCDADKAVQTAEEICALLAEHMFDLDEQTVQSSCSIGAIFLNASEFANAMAAMDAAFVALEEARKAYTSDEPQKAVKLFASSVEDTPTAETSLNLQEILNEDRLHIMFQPIINLQGETTEYYEATLRLQDEEGQELPIEGLLQTVNLQPGDTKLDKWIIVEATKLLKEHQVAGHTTRLIVNMTQNSLLDNEFCSWISMALRASEITPESLIFQYQETTLTHYLKQATRINEELRERNCSMSVSHFGRSMESFKTIQNLKIDFAVVDGSFTLELQKDASKSDELKTTLDRIKQYGAAGIVPYVENAATLANLWQLNVDFIQGHYLQGPSEAMDYEFSDVN